LIERANLFQPNDLRDVEGRAGAEIGYLSFGVTREEERPADFCAVDRDPPREEAGRFVGRFTRHSVIHCINGTTLPAVNGERGERMSSKNSSASADTMIASKNAPIVVWISPVSAGSMR
jgi:hypothetical protein